MTRSRYRIFETEYPYFMTSTLVGWLPLFILPQIVELIFDSWRFLQKQRQFQIFGYVILENHLHLIAKSPELPKDVQNFKSFTARKIIDLLQQRSSKRMLRRLRH
jgi:REP element-mobilizing transposase RayT